MKSLLNPFGCSLSDLWDDLWNGLLTNLLWTLAVLLVIPAPPATVALFAYASQKAAGEAVDVGDFWRIFRCSWGLGWRWAAVAGAGFAVLYGDFVLTQRYAQGWGSLVNSLYIALLAAWVLLQLYTLPFLFEQEQPSLRQSLRNAAVMIGRRPVYSLALLLVLAACLLVGTALFMLTFAAGALFTALAACHAVKKQLETDQKVVVSV